jgi:aldehyde dehydrogenase (NAD+)
MARCVVFGPGLETDSVAAPVANDSECGFTPGVRTVNESRDLNIVSLDTGKCYINCSSVNNEP